MSAKASPVEASSVDGLVNEYLRVLAGERGASPHTLRAYQRELHGFAAWVAGERRKLSVDRIEHTDSLEEHFTPRAGQTLADYLRRVRSEAGGSSAG